MYFGRIALPQGESREWFWLYGVCAEGASENAEVRLIMAWRIADYFKINF